MDVAISAIFLLEFFWRWRKRGWAKAFVARTWYEVFAMIPIAHPALYPHHIVTVVLLLVRIGRAADRAIGEQFFYRLVDRLSEPLVHAIKKPVTVAVLDEVVKVLETGNYPENLARSLTDNREQLRAIISEKLSEDQQLSRLKLLPFHAEIVHSVVDTVVPGRAGGVARPEDRRLLRRRRAGQPRADPAGRATGPQRRGGDREGGTAAGPHTARRRARVRRPAPGELGVVPEFGSFLRGQCLIRCETGMAATAVASA